MINPGPARATNVQIVRSSVPRSKWPQHHSNTRCSATRRSGWAWSNFHGANAVRPSWHQCRRQHPTSRRWDQTESPPKLCVTNLSLPKPSTSARWPSCLRAASKLPSSWVVCPIQRLAKSMLWFMVSLSISLCIASGLLSATVRLRDKRNILGAAFWSRNYSARPEVARHKPAKYGRSCLSSHDLGELTNLGSNNLNKPLIKNGDV